MRNKFIVFTIFLTACTTVGGTKTYPTFFQKMTSIKIGDTQESVLANLGKPENLQSIELQSKKFEVYEYDTKNGITVPIQNIVFSPETKKVVAVIAWVSPEQPEYNVDELIKIHYPAIPFKRLHSCDTHFGGRFSVAEAQGIVIAHHRRETDLIAVATPEYAKLWAAEISSKCPKLQSPEFLD